MVSGVKVGTFSMCWREKRERERERGGGEREREIDGFQEVYFWGKWRQGTVIEVV